MEEINSVINLRNRGIGAFFSTCNKYLKKYVYYYFKNLFEKYLDATGIKFFQF